jgi:hypothetical protein
MERTTGQVLDDVKEVTEMGHVRDLLMVSRVTDGLRPEQVDFVLAVISRYHRSIQWRRPTHENIEKQNHNTIFYNIAEIIQFIEDTFREPIMTILYPRVK